MELPHKYCTWTQVSVYSVRTGGMYILTAGFQRVKDVGKTHWGTVKQTTYVVRGTCS